MMLHTSDVATLYRVEGTQASNKVVHSQTTDPLQESKWDTLLAEFNNAFEKPAKLVS